MLLAVLLLLLLRVVLLLLLLLLLLVLLLVMLLLLLLMLLLLLLLLDFILGITHVNLRLSVAQGMIIKTPGSFLLMRVHPAGLSFGKPVILTDYAFLA